MQEGEAVAAAGTWFGAMPTKHAIRPTCLQGLRSKVSMPPPRPRDAPRWTRHSRPDVARVGYRVGTGSAPE